MMRATLLAAAILSGCTTSPAATAPEAEPTPAAVGAFVPTAAEEIAILAVVDRFMLAIGNHDSGAMEDLLITEGVAWFQGRDAAGEGRVQPFTNESLMEPAPDADPFLERYWDPIVHVRGGVASVWAPYELRDDGEVIHCGVDALNLVMFDGEWRVSNVMSTMEPEACDALRPSSASDMRPRDGWIETPLQ